MKKAISIGFLLLANLFLLAHAVMPHHHHDWTAVCIIQNFHSECYPDHHNDQHDCEHTDSPEPHSHRHANNHTTESCSLYEIYVRSDHKDFKVTSCAGYDCKLGDYDFAYTAKLTSIDWVGDIGKCLSHTPYLVTYQSSISSNCIGLRAPPAC